jgi:hypothetical protein
MEDIMEYKEDQELKKSIKHSVRNEKQRRLQKEKRMHKFFVMSKIG